jgi:hypothetical protein
MTKQTYRLINKAVMMNASAMLHNVPCDGSIEVIIQEYKKPRSSQQNAKQWADVLATIADQAWIEGRQYPVEVWHEFLKAKFLPESHLQGETSDKYKKYIELPDGSIKMVGSTTQLTTKGFSNYMENITAYAAVELGVQFRTRD